MNKSILLLLIILLVQIQGAQPAPQPAKGPLRLHPQNPRYFTDGTKMPDGSLKAVYLTGAHTWNNLVDMGRNDPPEPFDFEVYLKFLVKHGHNFIRLWAWDSTTWDTRANGALGKDFVHQAAPLPWARTGPGQALDGKPKFDLTQFAPAYFQRLRSRVVAAGEQGIYVSVMLFEGWGLFHGNRRRGTDDGWAWRTHPFNPANNINGLSVAGADAFSGKVHTLRNPGVNQLQAAYLRKVADTLNDLDNVLYEVLNEGGEKEWNWWVIQTLHDYERTKPKQHPVGNTGHGAERLPTLLASPAEWISPGRADGFGEDPPAWNEKKVSLLDTDHIWGVGGNAAWVWKSFLRGHNPLFMDPYDGSVLGQDRGWETIRVAMGHTRRFAEKINLASMTPHDGLASTKYCLANPGQEYLIYQPGKGSLEASVLAGVFQVEWFHPATGASTLADPLRATGDKVRLTPPWDGPAVVYLKCQENVKHTVINLGFSLGKEAEDSAGGMIVADVDNDRKMDFLVTAPGHLAVFANSGKELWRKQVDLGVGGQSESQGLPGHHGPGVAAADIDEDGKTEVVFLTKDSVLHIVDGATGQGKATAKPPIPPGAARWELAMIATFQKEANRDLLLQATNEKGYRMGKFMTAYQISDLLAGKPPLWTTDQFVSCAHNGARLADLDGDGLDEILGATIFSSQGKFLVKAAPFQGHMDSVFVADLRPDQPGLEVVLLEEGSNEVQLLGLGGVIWRVHYERQEPQNATLGRFKPGSEELFIWCRSRYNERQKPFVFDSKGNLVFHYEMDKVAPEDWTKSGVEVIHRIDWTGQRHQLACAKERHKRGDVCLFEPLTGKFVQRFKTQADRLYVADVAGDWREEIMVISDDELHIYENQAANPRPDQPRLWNDRNYGRLKQYHNYYSP